MFSRLFQNRRQKRVSPSNEGRRTDAGALFARQLTALDADPYLMIADPDVRLISVFDDLRYDRADMDMLSGPMRRRALDKLRPLGFSQRSGSELVHRTEDIVIHLPKFRALGASPFDALRDTDMRAQDYALLTPTQAAAQIIDRYPIEMAVDRIKKLVCKHPANLLRLDDFLDRSERHSAFRQAIGHLIYVQREAVSKEPLRTRRALR